MTHSHPIDATALLRAHGLRVTQQRIAVLEGLNGNPHADAETVHRLASPLAAGITLQAVYLVLGALTDAGLARRIEPAGSAARYELRVGDNHHHIVCRGCGAVEDVDCTLGEAPCLHPSSTSGFTVETAEVTFWGLCPSCAAAAS